jgi:hypothetical protein
MKLSDLDKNKVYWLRRVKDNNERFIKDKEYKFLYTGIWSCTEHEDPHKKNQHHALTAQYANAWEISRIDDPKIQYFKKIKMISTATVPLGGVIKVNAETGRTTEDSPYKCVVNLHLVKENKNLYWEEITGEEYEKQRNKLNNNPIPQPKEPAMSKPTEVKVVTQINQENADVLSDNAIIELIKDEQAAIDALKEVKVDSRFIGKQVIKHQEAIAALVAVLDAR